MRFSHSRMAWMQFPGEFIIISIQEHKGYVPEKPGKWVRTRGGQSSWYPIVSDKRMLFMRS